MQTVLLVIHLMVVLSIIVLVLMQRSEGGGLGMGSSNSSGFMSARGTANALSRTTAILAGIFFTTSLILAIIAGNARPKASVLDKAPSGTPSQQVPAGGNLLDSLKPQAPATPQAPQR